MTETQVVNLHLKAPVNNNQSNITLMEKKRVSVGQREILHSVCLAGVCGSRVDRRWETREAGRRREERSGEERSESEREKAAFLIYLQSQPS